MKNYVAEAELSYFTVIILRMFFILFYFFVISYVENHEW